MGAPAWRARISSSPIRSAFDAGNGGVLKKVEDAVDAWLAGTLSDSDYETALMSALTRLGTYESHLLVKSGDPQLATSINDLWDWAERMREIIEAMLANI